MNVASAGLLVARLDLCSLLEEERRRRRLHSKVKDLSWKAVMTTGIGEPCSSLLGCSVERFAEFHDIQATLTKSGTYRRGRVGLPAGICSLI
jgi:hypothetical protein